MPGEISHGFFWFFTQPNVEFPTIAVGGAVDKLFVDAGEGQRGWCGAGLGVF
jgi:hypothetical protein